MTAMTEVELVDRVSLINALEETINENQESDMEEAEKAFKTACINFTINILKEANAIKLSPM